MVDRGERRRVKQSLWKFPSGDSLDDPCSKKKGIFSPDICNRDHPGDWAVSDDKFVFLCILIKYFNELEVSCVKSPFQTFHSLRQYLIVPQRI